MTDTSIIDLSEKLDANIEMIDAELVTIEQKNVDAIYESKDNEEGISNFFYYSPNLKKSIALGVVKGGKNMMGQKLIIPMEKKNINVTVADPVFLDKENKRLNA